MADAQGVLTTPRFICLSYLMNNMEKNVDKYWQGRKTQLDWMFYVPQYYWHAEKLFWKSFNVKCTCHHDEEENTGKFIKWQSCETISFIVSDMACLGIIMSYFKEMRKYENIGLFGVLNISYYDAVKVWKYIDFGIRFEYPFSWHSQLCNCWKVNFQKLSIYNKVNMIYVSFEEIRKIKLINAYKMY